MVSHWVSWASLPWCPELQVLLGWQDFRGCRDTTGCPGFCLTPQARKPLPLERGTAPPSGSSVEQAQPLPHPSRPRTSSLAGRLEPNILSGLCSPVSACGFLQARAGPSYPAPWQQREISTPRHLPLGQLSSWAWPSPACLLSCKVWRLRSQHQPEEQVGALVPKAGSPGPALGRGHLDSTQCPGHKTAETGSPGFPPSARRSPPSSSVHGWLLTHGAPVGAFHPRGRSQVGPESAARLLPLLAPGAGCRLRSRAGLKVPVSFYMYSPARASSVLALRTPSSPAPGTHLPSQELEKPLSGARPLPHPPSQGVCLALPCPPSPFCISRWPGRQGSYKRKREAGLSPAGPQPFSPPIQPRH